MVIKSRIGSPQIQYEFCAVFTFLVIKRRDHLLGRLHSVAASARANIRKARMKMPTSMTALQSDPLPDHTRSHHFWSESAFLGSCESLLTALGCPSSVAASARASAKECQDENAHKNHGHRSNKHQDADPARHLRSHHSPHTDVTFQLNLIRQPPICRRCMLKPPSAALVLGRRTGRVKDT